MADNLHRYGSREQPCDITYSSDDLDRVIEHPETYGYTCLRSCNSETGSGEEYDDLEEFARSTEQRQHSTMFTNHYDESIDAESSSSSNELSSSDGMTLKSVSKASYGSSPEGERKLEVCHEYDEEHTVQSSSSETSPREEPERNMMKNSFSRHTYSGGTLPTPVNTAIKFPISNTHTNTFKSSYSSLHSCPEDRLTSFSTSQPARLERGYANSSNASKTVRGMTIRESRDREVRLDIGDPDSIPLLPGHTLCKSSSSSLTRDASPVLHTLDKQSITSREMSDMSRPGYDHRQYGSRDSLEHQHPARQNFSASISEGSTTSHSNTKTGNGKTGPVESINELDKKKLRKQKKAEIAKNAWTTADSKVGSMQIDAILDYLGEKNTGIITGKKKKEKKDNKKEIVSSDKKQERDRNDGMLLINKKKDCAGNNSKRRQGKQVNVENKVTVSPSELSLSKSAITQMTLNNHVISRIILPGEQEIREAEFPYTERNIDEAIEQSKSLAVKGESDDEIVSKSSATEIVNEQGETEATTPLASQTISVTYNINLTPEPQELKEGEFKEVVHKKKKVYSKQSGNERDGATAIVAPTVSVPSVASKPMNKLSPKLKGLSVSSHRSVSPTRKYSENLTEHPSSSIEAQYDFCEKSFPTLSGDHKPQIAMVSPFCSSWAAKVASTSASIPQPVASCNVAGDGDHCTDSKPLSSINSCVKPEVSAVIDSATEVEADSMIILDNGMTQAGESLTTNVCTLTYSAIDSSSAVINQTERKSSSSPYADKTPEDVCMLDNVNVQNLNGNYVVSPRITTNLSMPRASKKSNKVVEFVGRSFNEKHKTSSPNIQFGFISNEILSQTSLGQQEEEPESPSAPLCPSSKPVDVLPYLLKMKDEPSRSFSYPIFLKKSVQMLKKEFSVTIQQWKRGTAGHSGGPKVLRWSPDL